MAAPPGLYFEDYALDQPMTTRARTITEADIVQFAGLTGDYNPMHTDAELMKRSPFGQRIAHGMLTLSYAVGQAYQLGFMEGRVLAFRGLEMKFSLPVFIGDTVHVVLAVKEKKEALRMGGGLVTLDVKIVNQDGKTVQSGTWTVLVSSRAAEEAAARRAAVADSPPPGQGA
jgi:acyl dehydratase